MVIHIEFDIKITDHNGIVIQSTGNHCDENVSSDGKQDTDNVLNIDFTDFLAEYLSTSGYFLREKLMKGRGSGKLKRHVRNKTIREGIKLSEQDEEGMADLLKNSELEYKIRIGNNKVLIGKIPLKLEDDRNPEMGNNIISSSLLAEEPAMEGDTNHVEASVSEEETNNMEASDRNEEANSFESSDNDEEVDLLEPSDQDDEIDHFESSISDREPVCNLLNYSMMRAIEKYEDNIYNVWYEPSNDMEPVIDEFFGLHS